MRANSFPTNQNFTHLKPKSEKEIQTYLSNQEKIKRMKRINDFIHSLLVFTIVNTVFYLFLCVCNWEMNPGNWNAFSRITLGILGLLTMLIVVARDAGAFD